jgi:hypothetical protein
MAPRHFSSRPLAGPTGLSFLRNFALSLIAFACSAASATPLNPLTVERFTDRGANQYSHEAGNLDKSGAFTVLVNVTLTYDTPGTGGVTFGGIYSTQVAAVTGKFVIEKTDYDLFALFFTDLSYFKIPTTAYPIGTDQYYVVSLANGGISAPTISLQPQSQQTAAGSSVIFTAQGSGTGPLAYQWRKDGAAVSGASTATLVLQNVSAANAGTYTVIVTNPAGSVTSNPATLTVLASSSDGRLINLAVRSAAGSGDSTLIAGFVISGQASKTVLIRAIGPTLAQFGVGSVLADPQLKLFNSSSNQIGANDDWGGDATLAATFAKVGAFALPSGSKDAAILVTLVPGSYSAQVTSANGTTGIALLEVYDVP